METVIEDVISVQKEANIDDVTYREIKDPYGFIYITTNLVNGIRYLGQKRFDDKWKKYLGSGTVFKKAVTLYGKENFHRNIIDMAYSEEELNQKEYEYSMFFDVVSSEDWYNLVWGGGTTAGWHMPDETKKKIGEKAKERLAEITTPLFFSEHIFSGEKNSQYGISPKERMNEETYDRWYEKHKPFWENPVTKGKHIWEDKPHPNLGKHLTEEQKENLSIKAKERYENSENHPMYGNKHSNSTKQKMSNVHKLRNIEQGITIYSLNFNRIFYGAIEVAREFNIDPSGVTACCKRKKTYCGIDPNTGEKMKWIYTPNAIDNGYLSQERYNMYVNNIKKEIDQYGKSKKR